MINICDRYGRVSIIFVFVLLFSGFSSATLVINSDDWKDVYAGMQYAESDDRSPYFTRSADGSVVLSEAPVRDTVLIESSENFYLPTLETRLEQEGYSINRTIEISESTELVPENVENFVVVSETDSAASAPAAPLAKSIDGWSLVISEDNRDEVTELVEDAEGSVIMVGDFGSSSRDAVEPHSDEWIEGENRFGLSTNVAERIEDEQEFSNVLVSDGQALESDIVTGDTPVLLSGTNFLPDETEEYIQGNEEISSATVIGPQLAVVGREISDSLEAEGRDIRILAKQGHARGGDTQQEVSALPLFPLPFTQLELEINSAEYLPGQDQLLVSLSNPTESDIYKTSAIDLVMDDEILESFADDEPELIPAGSSSIVSYDVDVTEDEAESMDAEFTTAFGGSPINLDTYVESQEENIFGPPKTLPVSILEFEDDSQANISEVFYNTETNEFEVEIINEGEDEAYARVSLENLEIDGVAESFTSDTVRAEPGESETVSIEALLEEEDLEENEFATVSLSYGERESLLVNSEEHQTSLDAISEGLVDGRNLILLLILAAIISYGVYRSS